MRHYDFIEHAADIAIRAYGNTLEDAFAEAAQGMFDIITDSSRIENGMQMEFTVEGIDRETMLVGFLSRLIAIHEIERVVLGGFAVTFTGLHSLSVSCHSELFNAGRHGCGIQVKGVSYHMLEIRDAIGVGEAMVQVLFDI